MMNNNRPFWQTGFGKSIRWLLFLPVGYILVYILQVVPPLVAAMALHYKPEFNFLVLIIGIIAVSLLCTLGSFWVMGVFMTPTLCCKIIAPNNKIGSVIFGTLFCLFQGFNILASFGLAHYWVSIIYQTVFGAITIGGTVMAYMEDS
ncbi:MAG: hypothetical protein KKH28_08310 [Elusimicrobia bacterium]|nr:hypothetical protein [Elusimicrobiota bacterium]